MAYSPFSNFGMRQRYHRGSVLSIFDRGIGTPSIREGLDNAGSPLLISRERNCGPFYFRLNSAQLIPSRKFNGDALSVRGYSSYE